MPIPDPEDQGSLLARGTSPGVPLRVLIVEDNRVDAHMIQRLLGEHLVPPYVNHVTCLADAREQLSTELFDVVLLDLVLPDSTGIDTVVQLHSLVPHLPIVVLTGLETEELEIQALHAGAQDYLRKGHVEINLLIRSINYAIERKRVEGELRKSREDLSKANAALTELTWELDARVKERTAELEEREAQLRAHYEARQQAEQQYRDIFNNAVLGIFRTTPEGRILAANPRFASMLGYDSPEDLITAITSISEQLYVNAEQREEFKRLLAAQGAATNFEHTLYRRDGSIMWSASNSRAIRDEQGNVLYYDGTLEDITERKRAEEALRSSAARLATAQERAKLGNWEADLVTGNIYWSAEMFRLLGRDPSLSAPTFEEFLELVHPDDRYLLLQDQAQAATHGTAERTLEIRSHPRLVPIRHFSATVCNVQGVEGNLVRLEGTVLDITDRKRARDALQQQLARINLLNRIARSVAERHDLLSIYGVVVHYLENDMPVELGSAFVYDGESQTITLARRGPKSDRLGEQIGLPANEAIPITDTLLTPCAHGNSMYTPDMGKVDMLLARNFLAHGLQSAAAEPIVVDSEVIGIIAVSRAEVDGFSEEDREFLRAVAEHVALAARQARMQGDLRGAYDDLKRAQASIVQQERLRALGELASGIAHDFNNALGPVLGYSEILLMRPENLEDSEKLARYLKLINTGARDAAAVVTRLREFYRKRDETEVFVPVNLAQLAQQTISLTQPKWKDQAQASGRTVRIETDLQEVPPIAGNEHELREVLTNIIFNAVDAMPEGGTITIGTMVKSDSNDTTTGGRGDAETTTQPFRPLSPSPRRRVVLSIKDTGTGMSEEVRRRCQEPFFSTKGERGTGLGLSMVHGIVQRHEGTVVIESELGRGTCFILHFPVQVPSELVAAPATPDTVRPLSILYVDDEPGMRDTIREYLIEDGHKVETAADGAEALQKFNAGRFDLVITDRAMPDLGGDQLAAAIKTMAPNTPVIMLTGFGDLMQSAGELPDGVTAVVAKPVTLRTLRETIVRAVAST